MRVHRLIVSALLSAAPVVAQGSWTFRSLATNPLADSPALAFDSQRNVAVLLVWNGGPNADTWEWNGTGWQRRSAIGMDRNNARHTAMVFDSTRNTTVLFGGTSGLMLWYPGQVMTGSDQTWEWDGLGWTNVAAVPAPPPRCKHGMAYDAARHVTVVFGGLTESTQGSNAIYRDTWLWDGQSWLQRNPVAAPAPRHGHAMAYDATRQRTVLFGGNNRLFNQPGPFRTFGDTWEWDGSNWFQAFPASSPPPRQEAAMAYDSRNHLTILHGGVDANNVPLGDTWLWDGSNWRQALTSVAPASRYDAAMTFDTLRGTALLFGGSVGDAFAYVRDTWEFSSGAPASYVAYGAGCSGSRGVLGLGARLGSLPIGGQTFFAQITGLPLTAPAFVFLGASRTAYGPVPLPLDLTPLGFTGCSLLASGDFVFTATNILGSGTCAFDIPLGLAGQRFYNQAIAMDPLANPGGLTLSNGAEALVGY